MAIMRGIPESHTHRHGTNYGIVWDALSSPIYRVLDEEGSNPAYGQVRHLLGRHWLYVDDTDGYEIMEEAAVKNLILEQLEE